MDLLQLTDIIIIKILSLTDFNTINNFKSSNTICRTIINNNINYIFDLMCDINPFLKYRVNKWSYRCPLCNNK